MKIEIKEEREISNSWFKLSIRFLQNKLHNFLNLQKTCNRNSSYFLLSHFTYITVNRFYMREGVHGTVSSSGVWFDPCGHNGRSIGVSNSAIRTIRDTMKSTSNLQAHLIQIRPERNYESRSIPNIIENLDPDLQI